MRWWALLASAVLVVYPLLVYVGMRWLEPRFIGLIVGGIYALRLLLVARKHSHRLLIVTALLALAALFWLLNSELLLRLVPAFINLGFALGFGYTLVQPPTLPARMAKLQHGYLTPEIEHYTTRVTWLWLALFCFNGSLAVITALWASRALWTLYNGLIAYILIGLLAGGEYAYRKLVFHKKHNL